VVVAVFGASSVWTTGRPSSRSVFDCVMSVEYDADTAVPSRWTSSAHSGWTTHVDRLRQR
jgi:hypothetical protein